MKKQSIFFLLLFLLSPPVIVAQERITNFESNIVIHKDASMTVTENITVYAEGKSIRHGLVREFPTQYKDRLGNYYNVDFKLINVLRDGEPEQYSVDTVANGKKIYIGRKEVFLHPGMYTYSITYETNRQLGHFDDRDELYWNVTGNGWRLAIDQAHARVVLPSKIAHDTLRIKAFTGFQCSHDANFTSMMNQDGSISFKTTARLRKNQGLTIVVGWPAGLVIRPTMIRKVASFFNDNIVLLSLLLILLLLFMFFMYVYLTRCRIHVASTIIPLFYPPDGLSAGAVLHLNNKGYNHKVLAVEIVDMARAGYLSIKQTEGFWSQTYILTNKLKITDKLPETILPKIHAQLHEILFKESDTVRLGKQSREILIQSKDLLKEHFVQEYSSKWFKNFYTTFILGAVFACLAGVGPMIQLKNDGRSGTFILLCLAFIYMLQFFYKRFKVYTYEGKDLLDEVLGFKMFLETTEKERMKIIGTPPERTPELYEKYLPYAIALGVEKAWSKQFVPLFAHMEQQGHAYIPLWYYGVAGRGFRARNFSSNLSKSFSAAIASSVKVPGSGSGFGGGSSGGGGGGGGGGGW